jgi:hypothetical protein
MNKLDDSVFKSFVSGLKKLTGYERRIYAAELALAHFDGSARKTERILGVSRKMVSVGLHEVSSGFRCLENFSQRGSKKKKASYPTSKPI